MSKPGFDTDASAGLTTKVVIRMRDGRIRKGFASRFGGSSASDLRMVEEETGRVHVIPYVALKAVFFVKSFEGDYTREEHKFFRRQGQPGGRATVVTFLDGEEMYGYTQSHEETRNGFFLYPADPKSNNERIYIIASAVSDVVML